MAQAQDLRQTIETTANHQGPILSAYLIRLKDANARTLAILAADDLLEIYRLHVDVPESYRWGDPYVAPLTLVLD